MANHSSILAWRIPRTEQDVSQESMGSKESNTPEQFSFSLFQAYSLQNSCLKHSMDKGNWQATVHGVTKSQTRLRDYHSHFQAQHRVLLLEKQTDGVEEVDVESKSGWQQILLNQATNFIPLLKRISSIVRELQYYPSNNQVRTVFSSTYAKVKKLLFSITFYHEEISLRAEEEDKNEEVLKKQK